MTATSPSGANPARVEHGKSNAEARTHTNGRPAGVVPSRSPWSRAEQETTIRWDEEERIVHVYSASPKTWRKMARLGIAPARETVVGGAVSGRFYRVPAEQFRWHLKSEARSAANRGRRPGAPRA